MTIGFSENWSYYSWNRTAGVDLESERHLIEEMILHSDNQQVRTFAENQAEYGVYVRTGLHSSATERRDHIQVVLGSNDPSSWRQGAASTGFTAHIIFHDPRGNPTQQYETHVFLGQPHLSRVGT